VFIDLPLAIRCSSVPETAAANVAEVFKNDLRELAALIVADDSTGDDTLKAATNIASNQLAGGPDEH